MMFSSTFVEKEMKTAQSFLSKVISSKKLEISLHITLYLKKIDQRSIEAPQKTFLKMLVRCKHLSSLEVVQTTLALHLMIARHAVILAINQWATKMSTIQILPTLCRPSERREKDFHRHIVLQSS